MDLYTTTFTLPYPSPPGRAAGQPDHPDDNSPLPSLTTSSSTRSLRSLDGIAEVTKDDEADVISRLCREVEAREGCHVTASRIQDDVPATPGSNKNIDRGWNFCISGAQANVVAARGAIMRQMPRDNTVIFKVKRSDILVSPYKVISYIKADLSPHLDVVAMTTGAGITITDAGQILYPAQISTPISPQRSLQSKSFSQHRRNTFSIGRFGSVESLVAQEHDTALLPFTHTLEAPRMCDIVITGSMESVALAKVRTLVVLDELSGLHVQTVDINYKLQAIMGGRRRAAIQAIQEETATNIYFSVPLVGVLDSKVSMPPPLDPAQRFSYANPAFYAPRPHQHLPYQSYQPNPFEPVFSARPQFGVPWGSPVISQASYSPRGDQSSFAPTMSPAPSYSWNNPYAHNDPISPRSAYPPAEYRSPGPYMHNISGFVRPPNLPSGVLGPEQYGRDQMHPGLNVHSGEQGHIGKANEVWVTGEQAGVQRAVEMLKQLQGERITKVISRDATILPRKLDWLLTEKLGRVREVLYDNGTYLQVPGVGSQTGIITVFGEHRVGIERTFRQIMQMIGEFCTASIWLLPRLPGHHVHLDMASLQPHVRRIANDTGAEVVLNDVGLEVYGLEEQVRLAVLAINAIAMIQDYGRELRFRIELANAHREFISGKKNGKLNKIMKTANVKIKFEISNEYNFIVELSGTIMGEHGVFVGLELLMEELPAELSFHVPEAHHKRIIGVQGRTIQGIMRALGVYVKFSNDDEHAATGGYEDNEDNVIARTPRKNQAGLETLRRQITDLVLTKDRNYTKQTIEVARASIRALLVKHVLVRDIERKTNVKIRLPVPEAGKDEVFMYGPHAQIAVAATMLMEHVPYEMEFRIEQNDVVLDGFAAFAEQVKRDYRVGITIVREEDLVFRFTCPRSVAQVVGKAKAALVDWLAIRGVSMPPPGFSPKKRPGSSHSSITSAASLDQPINFSDIKLRTRPASTTNVKALFDASPGRFSMSLYGRSPEDAFTSNGIPLPQTAPLGMNMWHHSNNAVSGGLPFMSASVPVATVDNSPDALRRPASLVSLDAFPSALGLHSMTDADATPKPTSGHGVPQAIPVPAQVPVSGPLSHVPGLSLVNLSSMGEFTPTANDGLHDTRAHQHQHQRTTSVSIADPGFMVDSMGRGRYAQPRGQGQGYMGHQRGPGGRAQSLDITGFNYTRYMRPVTPQGLRVEEAENEDAASVGSGSTGRQGKVGKEEAGRSRSPLGVVDMPNLAQQMQSFDINDR